MSLGSCRQLCSSQPKGQLCRDDLQRLPCRVAATGAPSCDTSGWSGCLMGLRPVPTEASVLRCSAFFHMVLRLFTRGQPGPNQAPGTVLSTHTSRNKWFPLTAEIQPALHISLIFRGLQWASSFPALFLSQLTQCSSGHPVAGTRLCCSSEQSRRSRGALIQLWQLPPGCAKPFLQHPLGALLLQLSTCVPAQPREVQENKHHGLFATLRH